MVQGPSPHCHLVSKLHQSLLALSLLIGTYSHVWWGCPHIKPFWMLIAKIYHKVFGVTLNMCPEIALLSILPGCRKSQKASLLALFLIATEQLIPPFRKPSHTHTLASWVNAINHQQHIEELRVIDTDSCPCIFDTWTARIMYSSSDKLKAHFSIPNRTQLTVIHINVL